MPASEMAFSVLAKRIREARTREQQDANLDLWLRFSQLATEWDAEGWGFYPDLWMVEARTQMDCMRPIDPNRRRIVSLVCCVDPAEGCTCEIVRPCGGVHILDSNCQVHGTDKERTWRSAIHEAGERRTTSLQ